MADSKCCWSDVTYRLDELDRCVGFPQLIQVTEGIDTGNDIDSFSAEDVLMIDQCVILQKVAAHFATEKTVEVTDSGSEYAILKDEILIPLNYKGKLKVMGRLRSYNNVRELALDFPKYATALTAMRVPQDTGGMLEIAPDSKVELDRVIPGRECDKLVISTELGGRKQVAVPFDTRGRFRACPDDNEYTLKEVIDRYNLPKVIKFLDNKIQKIYTQDLLEGIEDMAHVTGSALQINRLVLQKVLIGHYKEPDETRSSSGKFCKRTLVVIPLDSPGIREITVRVRLSNAEDDPIYEPFLVRNVNADTSDYVDMAEGLYVEFVKRPRIIKLKEDEDESVGGGGKNDNEERVDEEEEETDEPPPPVPPRHGQPGYGEPPPVKPKPAAKPRKKPKPKLTTPNKKDGDGSIDSMLDKQANSPLTEDTLDAFPDYEVPENPTPPKAGHRGPSSTSSTQKYPKSQSSTSTQKSPSTQLSLLADSPFDKENVRKVKSKGGKEKHMLNKFTGLFRKKSQNESTVDDTHQEKNPENDEEDDDVEGSVYDEPDDVALLYDYAGQKMLKHENLSEKQYTSNKEAEKSYADDKQRPVAHVAPQTTSHVEHIKPKEFRLLKREELVERLTLCAMPEAFVEFCEKEHLNGEFLYEADDKMIKTFNLSPLHRQKLKKIIAGWVPT